MVKPSWLNPCFNVIKARNFTGVTDEDIDASIDALWNWMKNSRRPPANNGAWNNVLVGTVKTELSVKDKWFIFYFIARERSFDWTKDATG